MKCKNTKLKRFIATATLFVVTANDVVVVVIIIVIFVQQ